MKFDEKFLNSRKRMEFDLNRLLNLTWRWSLECSSCWIFFAAESSCKCTEKLNLICRCRTFGFHFSSATNFGWLSLDQFLMLRKNRQKFPEKATFRKVHNRLSLAEHNASLRNYYSGFSKSTTKKSVFHFGVKIQMRPFEHLGTRSILKIVNQSWMML